MCAENGSYTHTIHGHCMELPVSKAAGISKCVMLVSSYQAWAITADRQSAFEVCHTLMYSANVSTWW